MFVNPLFNALLATGYIVLVSTLMNFVTASLKDKPDTFFAPVAFLSLFTLSVAVMAFLFFYRPLILLIDGNKKLAVEFFLKTVGFFGIITLVVWILLYSGII